MQNGTATLEETLAVSFKTKHSPTISSSNWALSYLAKWAGNVYPYKNLNMKVYSSFIHNYPNLEAIKMSLNRWVDEQTIQHQYKKILFSNKKKRAIKPLKDMKEPWNHMAEWKKPNLKSNILYDSNHMTFCKR